MNRPSSYTMQFYRQFIGDGSYPAMPAVGDYADVKKKLSEALLVRAQDEKIEARMRPNKAVLLDHNQEVVAHIEVTVITPAGRAQYVTQDIP